MKKKMCSEDTRSSFKILQAIFTVFLVISGFGMAMYIYFLIALGVSDYSPVPIWQLDSSTPPYMGIIVVAVFMISWIGLKHVSKLEKSLC